MKTKFFAGLFCLAISLFLFSGCQTQADKKKEAENMEMMRKDSARMADSALAEDQRAKEEAENKLKNFDFTGRWVANNKMSIVFRGDSGTFDTGDGNIIWCKVNIDRTKNPMWLEMSKDYKTMGHITAFSMLLSVVDDNTITLGFGEDITVRPVVADPQNVVPFKRE